MNEVLRLENVTKSFKYKTAVNNISFSMKKGEVTAILGPNGAGKTTTISMILGLLKPTTGDIKLFNSQPQELHVRQKIGTMLQEVSVMPGLTINEILMLIRSYYPEPLPLKDLVNLTGLTGQDLKTRTEKLSGGQKRRLNFALALAGNPEFMIFDEPTVGMDITSRQRFWQTINTFANKGKTIIFSTHYLQEADDNAQRILLFKDGSIVADGTPQQIKSRISKKAVSFLTDPEKSLEILYHHPEIEQIFRKNNRVYIYSDHTDRILELLFQEKIGAHDIQIESGNLEEAFSQLTGENKEAI
ncbi:ABC transporter ATP-binding protein [Neobacillus sp. OS1-32]|uniref:ABC transporter ATP-binding protein n=1 Tax=Neobacillus sp. OS1-32 TaxID=3070682 RepID=UPI0027E1385B|nr:ABC transporter ATP-binding protein [Neobacillus sp. OS1-32]WML29023.1 ABC transporter ATP-binding protein [Neobacillus sp. OS1-32]